MITFGPYDGRDGHEQCREMLGDMIKQFELQYARAEALDAALQKLSIQSCTNNEKLVAVIELLNDIQCKHKRVPQAVKRLIENCLKDNSL
jgi:hypothetical protein